MPEINPTAGSLLGFLHQAEMTGWDLAQVVEKTIGYFWNVTRSQIYRELRFLETAGLVRGGKTGQRERKPYTITNKGREAFSRWIDRDPGPELIRFPLLLAVFFGGHLPPERLERYLRSHRLRHEARFEHYDQLLEGFRDSDDFVALTVRFGRFYEEAVLRWFDSLPSRVTHARPSGRDTSVRRTSKRRP